MSAVASLHHKKVALLHFAKRQLNLRDEDYRAILLQYGGVESAAELSDVGFDEVVGRLADLGFRSTWSKRNCGNRPGMANAAQLELVRKLWTEYRGGEDEAGLKSWLEHFHKVSALRFVNAQTAAKIIPGLKAMVARQQDRR